MHRQLRIKMVNSYSPKNRSGFSLVEVLVALGVVSIVGAGTMALIANNIKSVQNLSGRMAEAMLISDLNQIIADKDLCRVAFTSGSPQALNLTTYKPKIQASGYGVIQDGAEIQRSIKIDLLEIRDFGIPQPTGATNQMKVLGTLYIKTSDLQSGSVSRKEKIISTFGIYYDNGSKAIQSCFGVSAVPEAEICQKLGMNWDVAQSRCKQAPDQACQDLGGTWRSGSCVVGGGGSPLSIFGSSCSGSTVLAGYGNDGRTICRSVASSPSAPSPSAPSPSAPSPSAPSPSAPAPTPSPAVSPTPAPVVPKSMAINFVDAGGGLIQVGVNLAGMNPGDPVTYARYIDGKLISSGTVGNVSAAGTYSTSVPGSCGSGSPPCSTSYTICASGTCTSRGTTISK